MNKKPLQTTLNHHYTGNIKILVGLGYPIWTSYTTADNLPYLTFFRNLKLVAKVKSSPQIFCRLYMVS